MAVAAEVAAGSLVAAGGDRAAQPFPASGVAEAAVAAGLAGVAGVA